MEAICNDLTEYDGIKLRRSVLATEFGITGTASDREGVYVLNRDSIFYEFIPVPASSQIENNDSRPRDGQYFVQAVQIGIPSLYAAGQR